MYGMSIMYNSTGDPTLTLYRTGPYVTPHLSWFAKSALLRCQCDWNLPGETGKEAGKKKGKGNGKGTTTSHLEKTYRPGNANYRIQKV